VNGIIYPSGFSGAFSGPIAAGGSKQVTVTFTPTEAIGYSGNVTVNSDSTSGTNIIGISGTGATPTRIIGVIGVLDFGDVTVNSTGQSTLTISNTGNSALTVSGISYPNGFSGEYSGTIEAGNSHQVSVTFGPTALAIYNGSLTVNSDKTGGASSISLSGTGIQEAAQPDNLITLTPTRFPWRGGGIYNPDASNQVILTKITRGASKTAFVEIRNTGNQPATFSVTGDRSVSGFRVRYFVGSIEVTNRLLTGGLLDLGKAGSLNDRSVIKVRVNVKPNARLRSVQTVNITTKNMADETKIDVVQLQTNAK
jgi:hypothetical protein